MLVNDLLSGDNLSLQSIDLGSCDFRTASGNSLAVCHFHPFGEVRCLSTSRKQWICSAFRSAPSGRSVVVAPMVLKSFLRADLRALAYAMRTAIQSRATRSEEHTSELKSLMRIS